MPTLESLQSVLEVLNSELRIPGINAHTYTYLFRVCIPHTCKIRYICIFCSVPGHVDPTTGAPTVLFEFTATLSQHIIRLPPHMLPVHLSSTHRIAVDTFKARELAELFDIDRNIPLESRLSTILSLPTVEQACTKC